MFSRRTPARRAPRMYERGILCILIGAAVLLAPYFLTSPTWLNMIAGASVVGWFAVVLGVALTAVDLFNRAKGRKD
ncbi:conserved hypothetical protein [Burkholderiales bacterium 8X]|nr:conserved hypothetical protein [Burkholderiales bacterium 8X]